MSERNKHRVIKRQRMACNRVKKCLASLAIKEMKTTATLGFLLARDRIVFIAKTNKNKYM